MKSPLFYKNFLSFPFSSFHSDEITIIKKYYFICPIYTSDEKEFLIVPVDCHQDQKMDRGVDKSWRTIVAHFSAYNDL